jgi:hypothetical protein
LKSLRSASCLLIVLAGTAAYGQGAASQATQTYGTEPSTSAKAAIERLMAEYHQAVASHDGARLSSLFVGKGSAWFNVLSDAAYTRARAKNPAASKVRLWSFQQFAKVVSTSHATLDPQHANVRILTDGTIATVYFNYVFRVNGKAENRGSETWQLVKASDGWKIAAITYSSNPSALGF